MNKILITYGSLNSVPSPEGAAPAKVIEDTVRHLDKENFEVLSSFNKTLDPGSYDSSIYKHIKPSFWDKFYLLLLKIRYRYFQKKELFITAQGPQLLYFIAVSKYVKKYRFNKVIVHVSPGLVQMIKMFNPNCKIVFYHHGTSLHTKLSETQWERLLKNTVAIFGVNQAAGDKANTHFKCKIPTKHYYKIGNGVSPIPNQKVNKIDADFKVLFSGRICKEKGVLELIKAFKVLKEKKHKISLIIAGHVGTKRGIKEGTIYLDLCKKYIDENNLKVNFTGFLSQLELYKWYQEINVLVLPTDPKVYSEGMSLSLLEAMSMGKPLIATNAGGNPEVIKDGYNGFLIYNTENYAQEIADKIVQLYLNPDIEKNMIENALKEYKVKFTTKKMSENFVFALNEIGFIY